MARPKHPLTELAGAGTEAIVTAKAGPVAGKVAGHVAKHVVQKKLDGSGGPGF